MNQIKFISMTNQIQPQGNVEQTTDGIVVVNVRINPNIQITHNYKKKDEILIIFNDINEKFKLASDNQLEEIYKLHLGNINLTEPLHRYCEENLQKI